MGGFTSVMIDGSHLPFDENIALTRKVVEYAHDRNVTVEAEPGPPGRRGGRHQGVREDSSYTRPEEVGRVWSSASAATPWPLPLAPATAPTSSRARPSCAFDILEDVARRLPGFPIVLHGASSVIPEYVEMINQFGGKLGDARGVPEEMLRKAASMAVCKINIDSDLRLAHRHDQEVLRRASRPLRPRQYLTDARAALKAMVRHKIVNVLGCNGKA